MASPGDVVSPSKGKLLLPSRPTSPSKPTSPAVSPLHASSGSPLPAPAIMVCGGGSVAQMLVCLLAARYKVTAFTLFEDEAERWGQAVRQAGHMTCTFQGTSKSVRSVPDLITRDSREVRRCNIVVLAVPSNVHDEYLNELHPYVREGTIFAVMPARSGCDFHFRKVMGGKASGLGLVAFETAPWACRFQEWGKTINLMGTKETVSVAVVTARQLTHAQVLLRIQGLLGMEPVLVEAPNMMSISLANPGQVVHPGVMYGRWQNWDGKPVRDRPLFYHGVDSFTAEVLTGISDDIQSVCKALNRLDKSYDLSQVPTIFEWYTQSYCSSIGDASSLQTAMNTNHAYKELYHPMRQATRGAGLVPDFQYRYLTEDVPMGLCFTRGLAELLGVRTPTIDKVLVWCQEKLGREYLTPAGRMAGADVKDSRAPQAFGVNTKQELLSFLGIKPRIATTCFAGICG